MERITRMGSNPHPTSAAPITRQSPQTNRIRRSGNAVHLRGIHADLAPPANASNQPLQNTSENDYHS